MLHRTMQEIITAWFIEATLYVAFESQRVRMSHMLYEIQQQSKFNQTSAKTLSWLYVKCIKIQAIKLMGLSVLFMAQVIFFFDSIESYLVVMQIVQLVFYPANFPDNKNFVVFSCAVLTFQCFSIAQFYGQHKINELCHELDVKSTNNAYVSNSNNNSSTVIIQNQTTKHEIWWKKKKSPENMTKTSKQFAH